MSITRVVNNIASINANRNLDKTGLKIQKSIERLSSGLRINRAGDDAAGMTVSTRLKAQFGGLDRAVANAQDGINLIGVAEGSLDEVTTRIDRMRILAIQAGNTGVNDIQARQALQDEVFQSIDEINRIANTTQFNTNFLLNGDFEIKSGLIAGQDYVGVRIDQSPVASTLDNGLSFLNVRRTEVGGNQIVAGEAQGKSQVLNMGIKNQSDIAVSLGHWTSTVQIDGTNATAATDLTDAFFQGVSLYSSDQIVFEGVLSDGVQKFVGAVSVGGGNDIAALVTSINAAIVAAENAYFGSAAAVPDAFKTSAYFVATGANAGRITLTNTTTTFSESSLNITAVRTSRGGELAAQSLGVTRAALGAVSVLSGGGQVGNSISSITGSTFDTGAFKISVRDVVSAQQRATESVIQFFDRNGALMSRTASLGAVNSAAVINGEFVAGVYQGGTTLFNGSTITLTGTEVDGTTFTAAFTLDTTISASADTAYNDFRFQSISGLIEEINYRTRSYTQYSGTALDVADGDVSRFSISQFTYTNNATLRLVDDLGITDSESTFTLTFFQDTTNHVTFQDDAELKLEGFAETATFSINGGNTLRAEAGDIITLYGPESTVEGVPTPQVTLRVGSGLTAGDDVLESAAKEFVGTLNGGAAVTFRNGDQDVVFISGADTVGRAKFLTVDFDAIVDATKPAAGTADTGTTVIVSTINKSMNFHVGAFAEQRFRNAIGDLRADNLGFGRGSGRAVEDIDITSIESVDDALRILDEALDQVNKTRSLLGAATNRLEATVSNLSVTSENLTASYSRLRDADIARESSEFTKNQVLLQAGTSILAQANFMQQGFLALLG
ncbi:MAG: flagellin [bacterium]